MTINEQYMFNTIDEQYRQILNLENLIIDLKKIIRKKNKKIFSYREEYKKINKFRECLKIQELLKLKKGIENEIHKMVN